ncbi:MAG: alpha/beta fold hydrolase [Acidobacteria bacterium]|nr:alpha/beta fold hydrolase [Acidobacteriota bacterium]
MPRHFFYLHGLASSPRSGKARFLAEQFAARGLTLHCPDLNEPDFSTLTTTRMIGQVAAALRRLPPAPVALIGSSLGGFVALHLAEHVRSALPAHPVDRLVLLAPAFDFGAPGMRERQTDWLARWRRDGWTEVQHHGYNEPRRLHFELIADAARYDSFAVRAETPMLVLHGRGDEVVDPDMVRRFADGRAHVRLVLLDDDHRLAASIARVWTETVAFLGLDGGC